MSSPSRIPYTLPHRRPSSQIYPSSIHPFTLSPLLLFFFLTLLSTQHLTHTSAQAPPAPFTPVPAWGAGYARSGTRLFVLGGTSVLGAVNPLDQFISLDLATAWNANSPEWTQLPAGPQQSKFPATFSADGKKMFVFHIPVGTTNTSVYQYSLDTSKWTPVMNAAFPHSDVQGIGAVTDPNTDQTYFAAGYTDITRTKMDAWNWKTGQITTTDLPSLTLGASLANLFTARTFYSNVWSVSRKSILYFGGVDTIINIAADNRISEFIPATNAWRTMTTRGIDVPPLLAEHCAAANDDGTRMVVYGGRNSSTPVTGDIYVLNTITGEWVKGAPGPPRMNPACTIAGDQFLVWGGQDGTGALGTGAPMLIYNLTTATWVAEYVPPASYRDPTPPTSGTAPPSIPTAVEPEKPSNNLPPILGGVFGVLVLVLLIVGYILYRRRQQRKEHWGKNNREKKMIISAPTMTDFDAPGDFRSSGHGPGVKEGSLTQTPYSNLAAPHGSMDAGRPRGGVDFDTISGFNQPTSRSDPHTSTSPKPVYRRGPNAIVDFDAVPRFDFDPPTSRSDPHTSTSPKPAHRRGPKAIVDIDAVPEFDQPTSRSDPHTATSPKDAHMREPRAIVDFDVVPGFNQPTSHPNPHTTSPEHAHTTAEEEDEGEVFEKNLKSIDNQQRQLDLKRQLLVLQQQQGQQVTRSDPQQGSPVIPVLQHQQVRQVARLAPQEGSPVNSESGHWEMLLPASRGPQHVHGTTADFHPLPPLPPVKKSRVYYPPPPPTVQAYALGSQVSGGDGYDYGGGYGYGDDNSPMPPTTHRGGHNPQTFV